jgi:basic membrane lipoprotein Med (substrate-binding protein (PBP1-ABC) superfamily)
VAVVVPGTTADGGWNYSAKEAAEAIQKELSLPEPVSFVENVEQSRRKAMLREYGRDGYRLVICHGYEFNQVVKEIAGDFPETLFVISGYDQPDPRFGSIVYQLGEAAYLCGAMAAKITQTGHVGFVAAQQVPPVELCYQGFREGFLKHRPAGSVRSAVYIEGTHPWEDSAAAKEKTTALLRTEEPARIDLLFQNADAASRGIFEAVEQRPERIFVFGCNRDQNATTATRKVLASAVIRVDRAFVRVAQAVRAGTYQPHVASETISTGVIECIPSPRLQELVGADVAKAAVAAMEDARQDIGSGRVSLLPVRR